MAGHKDKARAMMWKAAHGFDMVSDLQDFDDYNLADACEALNETIKRGRISLKTAATLIRGAARIHHIQADLTIQGLYHEGELPIHTYVHGCNVPPCALPQLQDVVLDVVFKAPRTMRNMETVVTAYVATAIGIAVPAPYPLGENGKTCNFLVNTYCPIIKDEVIQYTLKMYIERFFPLNTQATLEFRVLDDDKVPVVCIRVGIRVVAAVDGKADRNSTVLIDSFNSN